MSNDLQTNLGYFMMIKIDYDKLRVFRTASLRIFFFAIHVVAKELNIQTFTVSFFADNVAIFVNGNALQFNYAFDILNAFGQKSGCKVNMNKSNAFCVVSSKGNVSQSFSNKGLSWPQNLVKYLGVNIPINNFYSSAICFQV